MPKQEQFGGERQEQKNAIRNEKAGIAATK